MAGPLDSSQSFCSQAARATYTHVLLAKASHMGKLKSMRHESIILPEEEVVITWAQSYDVLHLPQEKIKSTDENI